MNSIPRLISVAMASHNGTRFIEEQIRSIDSQRLPTGTSCEIVLADDCSHDGTLSLVTSLPLGNVIIRTVQLTEPHGVAAAFEVAINACRGEVIFLADQDDVWPVDRIARMLDKLDEGFDMVYGDYVVTGSDAKPLRLINVGRLTRQLLYRNKVPGMVLGFRSETKSYLLPIKAYIHDWWLVLLGYSALRVGYVQGPVTFYRQHDRNAIGHAKRRAGGPSFQEQCRRRGAFFREIGRRLLASSHSHRCDSRVVARLASFYTDLAQGVSVRRALRLLPVALQDPETLKVFLKFLLLRAGVTSRV